MEDTCVRACDWWVDMGYMCGSWCLVGGQGIHVWERVIGGWTVDTSVRACYWWVGDTGVRACYWWVDGGYIFESV